MTYSEKLKDPRWQKKRLEIMQRDKFTCCSCGNDKETLHVHHLEYIPKAEPWDYADNYLQTLCATCHETITNRRPELEKSILSGVRLKLTDAFILNCLSEIVNDAENLNDLVYVIWEVFKAKGEDKLRADLTNINNDIWPELEP